jgi:hypothetical protein
MNARTRVVALDATQAKAFCNRLWLELTIAGRIIAADDALDAVSQLSALKVLNEIQHRVWGAYASPGPDALAHLLDRIVAYCGPIPALGIHVRVALDCALQTVAGTGVATDSTDG